MTTLVHGRLRLKHSLLMLKITHPFLYKAFYGMAVLLMVSAIAGSAYLIMGRNSKPVSYAGQFKLEIKTYSLNGSVSESSGNFITVNFTEVLNENGVNKVSTQTKKVEIRETTKIVSFTMKNLKPEFADAKAADIKVGQNIAVYTSNDPHTSDSISASRIEIIK